MRNYSNRYGYGNDRLTEGDTLEIGERKYRVVGITSDSQGPVRLNPIVGRATRWEEDVFMDGSTFEFHQSRPFNFSFINQIPVRETASPERDKMVVPKAAKRSAAKGKAAPVVRTPHAETHLEQLKSALSIDQLKLRGNRLVTLAGTVAGPAEEVLVRYRKSGKSKWQELRVAVSGGQYQTKIKLTKKGNWEFKVLSEDGGKTKKSRLKVKKSKK